jgi:hypothetical protein
MIYLSSRLPLTDVVLFNVLAVLIPMMAVRGYKLEAVPFI